jgi:hypothetical protein
MPGTVTQIVAKPKQGPKGEEDLDIRYDSVLRIQADR